MPREVLLRKLVHLRPLLRELRAFEQASQAEIEAQHYAIERMYRATGWGCQRSSLSSPG